MKQHNWILLSVILALTIYETAGNIFMLTLLDDCALKGSTGSQAMLSQLWTFHPHCAVETLQEFVDDNLDATFS